MAAPVELDDLDVRILNELQADGRKSFRKIAESVDSTPATVINRVDRLSEEGVIRGYSADLDFERIGYQAIAAIEIMVRGEDISSIEELVAEHDNVVSAYSITGDSDILLLVTFQDREAMSTFVKEQLVASDTVQKTVTHMALDTIKDHTPPPVELDGEA